MKTLLVFFCSLFVVHCSLNAQDTRLQVVPYQVQGYNIQQVGYPSRMVNVGTEGDKFAYVEFFKADPGHRGDNRYIQCVRLARNDRGQEEVLELWNRPLTEPNKPQMEFANLYSLRSCLIAVGKQPDPQKRGSMMTVAQFWKNDGTPIGPIRQISPFQQNMTGINDEFYTSTGGECIGWLGRPETEDRNAEYHLAVYADQEARKLYTATIKFNDEQNPGGKFKLAQVILDKRGNAFFLLTPIALSGNASDTALRPRFVRYAHAERKYETYVLNFPGNSSPLVGMGIGADDHLYTFAAVSTGDTTATKALKNGLRLDGGIRHWNLFSTQRYNLLQNMALVTEHTDTIADSLVKRYTRIEEGANFTTARMMQQGSQVFWMLEEDYTQRKPQGLQYCKYDLMVLGYDPTTLALKWSNVVYKRQRDMGSNSLVGAVVGITDLYVHVLFLTDKGAAGKVLMHSINRSSGDNLVREMASNENGRLLFFPARSVQVQNMFALMGIGQPNAPNYALLLVKPLP